MGAWGIKNFENDGAEDYIYTVFQQGKGVVKSAIEKIVSLGKEEYLEAPECEEALAAIEIMAAYKGKPSSDCNQEVLKWVKTNNVVDFKEGLFRKTINITDLANQAIDRISSNSELRELWEESGDLKAWLTILQDLKERIK